jgi:hypothetical protein
MTILICANEHHLHWVYDSRLPGKAYAYPDTPIGTYWAIVAAFTGQKLEVVYFHETGKDAPTYADPQWMGILPFLGVDLATAYDGSRITDYPEFVHPVDRLLDLITSDYRDAASLPGFDVERFTIASAIKYNLQTVQISAAIERVRQSNLDTIDRETDTRNYLNYLYNYRSKPNKSE